MSDLGERKLCQSTNFRVFSQQWSNLPLLNTCKQILLMNSEDPDDKLHAASHHGLHHLLSLK